MKTLASGHEIPETEAERQRAEAEALDPTRQCGSCSLCCKLLDVEPAPPLLPEKKPPRQWCQHCEPGQGCKVYAERPEQCRRFYCLWRAGWFSDEERPDRMGFVAQFVLEPLRGKKTLILDVIADHETRRFEKLTYEWALAFLRHCNREGVPVRLDRELLAHVKRVCAGRANLHLEKVEP